jgi:hypothetical protein
MGIDISPMPVRHGQTPARRLHLPESQDREQRGAEGLVLVRPGVFHGFLAKFAIMWWF